MTLSGNQKRKMRSAARLYAVQALFQMEQTAQTVDQIPLVLLRHLIAARSDQHECRRARFDLRRRTGPKRQGSVQGGRYDA